MRYLLISLLLGFNLPGQVSSGTLVGEIRNEAGDAVSDARITLVREGTTLERTVNSSAQGSFRIDELVPGLYAVTAERTGYSRVHASGSSVAINQIAAKALEHR